MKKVNCPICEGPIEIGDQDKSGKRITCPNCFAQLGLFNIKGHPILGCAICKEPVFDPDNCSECERRHQKQKELIEEGNL
jgi:hypothetical protein